MRNGCIEERMANEAYSTKVMREQITKNEVKHIQAQVVDRDHDCKELRGAGIRTSLELDVECC